MTNIEQKALELVNEVRPERKGEVASIYDAKEALCRAIEQHEDTTKEIERLNGVIIATADHWLALQSEHPIAWEGAIDEAMAAACAKIRELTEQHEAFRQEVSDAVEAYNDLWRKRTPGRDEFMGHFIRFIIPKPDPLVEAMAECGVDPFESWADQLRAALAKRGLEIREKK